MYELIRENNSEYYLYTLLVKGSIDNAEMLIRTGKGCSECQNKDGKQR